MRRSDPAAAARDAGDTATEAEEALHESGRDLEDSAVRDGLFRALMFDLRCRNDRSCSPVASAALTPATTSATWGSTSRSSTAANGIGVSFAVTRTGARVEQVPGGIGDAGDDLAREAAGPRALADDDEPARLLSEATIASRSSGFSVRRSITSISMPSRASPRPAWSAS